MHATDDIPHVLLVDDDEDALNLMERLLEATRLPNPVHLFRDGVDVIAFLEFLVGKGRPVSALVLLDVHLPGRSGFDVLNWIRQHPKLNQVAVVMMSTSDQESDVRRARALGAQAYLLKFPSVDTLAALIRMAGRTAA